MSQSKRILIKVTGSIAAYKSADLVSKLVQAGYEVRVVTSQSALKFIGQATLEGLSGKRVLSDSFTDGEAMSHIQLMRWADLILVYPATANFINKAASGTLDGFLGDLYLAHDFSKPYLIAPAMNAAMYNHPTTQLSLRRLREMNIQVLGTGSGHLACGEVGQGRLLETEEVLSIIKKSTHTEVGSNVLPQKSQRILITSGGTKEPIDTVRSISNTSTGKTGAQIADYLLSRGHRVTYLHSEDAAQPGQDLERISFKSFADLDQQLKLLLQQQSFDIVIHLAAVSDFTLDHIEDQSGAKLNDTSKIHSTAPIKLVLKPNHKIIDCLADYSINKNIDIIGFKLTSNANETQAKQAIRRVFHSTQVKAVVHNDLSEIKPERGKHPFRVFTSSDSKPIECDGAINLAQILATELIENKESIEPLGNQEIL